MSASSERGQNGEPFPKAWHYRGKPSPGPLPAMPAWVYGDDECAECGYLFDDEEEGCDACVAAKTNTGDAR